MLQEDNSRNTILTCLISKLRKKSVPLFQKEPILTCRYVRFRSDGVDALLCLFVEEVYAVGIDSQLDGFSDAGL